MPLCACICLVFKIFLYAVFDLNHKSVCVLMLTLPLCPGNIRKHWKKNRDTRKRTQFHSQIITTDSNLQNVTFISSLPRRPVALSGNLSIFYQVLPIMQSSEVFFSNWETVIEATAENSHLVKCLPDLQWFLGLLHSRKSRKATWTCYQNLL